MFTNQSIATLPKPEVYAALQQQAAALLAGETDWIANTANLAALIFQQLPNLNWAGFYFLKDGQLVLGPFQGKPACVRIALGKGVCGTAAAEKRTVCVPDVHEFPGHIACDVASRSEIVVPIVHQGQLLGVLDLDSPMPARFTEEDAAGLERIVQILLATIKKKTPMSQTPGERRCPRLLFWTPSSRTSSPPCAASLISVAAASWGG